MIKLIAKLFLFISLLGIYQVNAQKNKKAILKFEQKMEAFRYSLFADIEKVKDLGALIREEKLSSPLLKKADAFVLDNKDEIKKYQKYKLHKYLKTIISFESFVKDTCFYSDSIGAILKERIREVNEEYEMLGSLGKLMVIHPLNHASRIIYYYEMFYYKQIQYLTSAEIGLIKEIRNIALGKIKAEMISDDVWKIYLDYYHTLYEFSYNFNSNKI